MRNVDLICVSIVVSKRKHFQSDDYFDDDNGDKSNSSSDVRSLKKQTQTQVRVVWLYNDSDDNNDCRTQVSVNVWQLYKMMRTNNIHYICNEIGMCNFFKKKSKNFAPIKNNNKV